MRRFRERQGCPGGRPSDDQQLSLVGFITEYALGELGIAPENIKGHCDSKRPKPTCPGVVRLVAAKCWHEVVRTEPEDEAWTRPGGLGKKKAPPRGRGFELK